MEREQIESHDHYLQKIGSIKTLHSKLTDEDCVQYSMHPMFAKAQKEYDFGPGSNLI